MNLFLHKIKYPRRILRGAVQLTVAAYARLFTQSIETALCGQLIRTLANVPSETMCVANLVAQNHVIDFNA